MKLSEKDQTVLKENFGGNPSKWRANRQALGNAVEGT
jgi:hypothetical protein